MSMLGRLLGHKPPAVVRTGHALDARLFDAKWMRRAYEIDQRTGPDIADELGCSMTTVYRHLRMLGIPIRSTGELKRGVPMRQEQREKIRAASIARWQREKAWASR